MGIKATSIKDTSLESAEMDAGGNFGALLDGEELGNTEPGSGTGGIDPIKAVSGSIDPRIQLLSYSSLLTLHSCPRKFQLYKLKSERATQDEVANVTFAFGHVVGEGLQLVFQGLSIQQITWKLFLMWDSVNLWDSDPKRHKSFAEAIQCIRKFIALRNAGFLEELELVYVPNPATGVLEPACELGFAVSVFDGFVYRGFVDAVLRNKETGEIIVLECKTTWISQVASATYKNSGQALGYSVVLDSLFPGISSYSVLYLVYSTSTLEFICLPFSKTFASRAEWIRSLVFDVEDITRYEEIGFYPKRGESCYSFFRDCEYLNVCNLSTSYLAKPMTESKEHIEIAEARYTHRFTLADIIDRQVERNS
jgi:hypothetical protein